jgi:hypothetical protein
MFMNWSAEVRGHPFRRLVTETVTKINDPIDQPRAMTGLAITKRKQYVIAIHFWPQTDPTIGILLTGVRCSLRAAAEILVGLILHKIISFLIDIVALLAMIHDSMISDEAIILQNLDWKIGPVARFTAVHQLNFSLKGQIAKIL